MYNPHLPAFARKTDTLSFLRLQLASWASWKESILCFTSLKGSPWKQGYLPFSSISYESRPC